MCGPDQYEESAARHQFDLKRILQLHMINLNMDGLEFNLDRICRACKSESEGMYSIYEAVAMHDQPTKLAEMLMACSSLQVHDGDGMPNLMCVTCIEQLNTAFNFKNLCETTDIVLREYIRRDSIKLEGTGIQTSTINELSENILDFNAIYSGEVTADAKLEIKPEVSDDPYVLAEHKVHACKLCEKTFLTAKNLRLHQRKHRKPSDYKCKQCSEQFPRLILLRRHMRVHEVQKVYVCKICNKTVLAIENLKRHLTIHLRTKPYTCELCNRGFKRADHLANHSKSCKGFRTFVCGVCNKGFTREDSLQLHLETHETRPNLQVLESLDNYEEHYVEVDSDKVTSLTEVISESDWSSESEVDDVPDDNYEDQIEQEQDEPPEEIKSDDESEKKENSIPVFENNTQEPDNPHDRTEIETLKAETPDSNWVIDVPVKRKRGRPRKGEVRPPKPQKKVRKRKTDKSGKYPCEYCNKVLLSVVGYDSHIRKHTGNKLYSCRYCSKIFVRASQLTRHYASNECEKTFTCKLCSKSFGLEDELQVHLLDHANEELQQCDVCEEMFDSVATLDKHKSVKHKTPSEKKFKCHVCGKGFTTDKYRDIHVRAHTGEKNSECKTCGKRFNTKARLAEHMKFHDECSKKFLCSECGQRFIRYDYLVIHMRRHRGEKPFKCKYCGKGFPRTTDLTVHERYHTGEKTHLCMVCGRGFGRAYNLTVHMRTHTGEKPYQCTYCDAAFAQGNDLKAHVRRHTGERYHCDMCSEAFLMGYLLTQHKRSVHGIDITSHIRRLKPSERVHLPTSQHPPLAPAEVAQLQLAQALQDVTVINIPTEMSENQPLTEALVDTQNLPMVPHVSDAVA